MQKRISKEKASEVSISIPPETLEVMAEVARRKELPLQALLKLYIGQGLRQDLTEEEATELALKRLRERKSASKSGSDLAA